MAATVSLAQMVDLALGTPEVGAVNFNVLHTLLHAMLNKLDLSNITTELSPEDRDLLTNNAQNNKAQTGEKTTDNQSTDQKDTDKSGQDGTQGGGVATKKTPYHVLQQKVARLEEQMQKLNELPSNADLFERSKGGDGERPRPVADMWQNVQLKNRVDANEEGIGKLMSLVEDLMAEMSKVKEDNRNLRTDLDNHNIPGLRTDLEDLRKKMEELDIQSLRDFLDKLKMELEKLTNRMDNMADLDAMMKRLKDLETLANALNDKLSKYPDANAFNDYVTWKALEEALKGLRDDLEPKERIVIEMQTQTSRPPSAKEPSRPPSSTGPSEELTRMLEDLGILTKRHDAVEVRVDKLEEEMPNKADKADLAGLSTGGPVDVPDDLLQQLKDLQDQLKVLSKARDKLLELEEKLSQLPDLAGIEENIDGLNIGQDDLQNMLDALRNEYEGNMTALEDKLNSLSELAMNQSVPEPQLKTPPRSPTPVKLPPIPGAEPPPDNTGKLSDLENALSKKDSEMRALQQKIKWLMTDTNKQVGDVKDKLKNLEKELLNFNKQPKKLPSPVRSKPSDMGRKRPSLVTATANTSTSNLPQLPRPDSGHVTRTPSAPSTAPHSSTHITDDDQADSGKASQATYSQTSFGTSSPTSTSATPATPATPTTSATPATPAQPRRPIASAINSKDSEALSRLQQIVLQLQAELDRLNQAAQKLTDENNNQNKQIEGLLMSSDKLERIKADKEYVQSEVDVKADKRLVEGKVNRSVFDETTDELNRMIKELLDKLGGKEDEWKKALGTLNEDVDGKLDRLEFGPIKDELERRLKALARQLRELSMRDGDLEDDAAGIRRQLLQRYNCISCDRPVDMMPQGPIPSIPAPQGLPATRSTRPHTTFELEQIRQHARSSRKNSTNFKEALLQKRVIQYRMHGFCIGVTSGNDSVAEDNLVQMNKALQQPGVEVVDLYATARACGGGHTMTQPHRRITRVAQYNPNREQNWHGVSLFRDDEIAAPVTREPHHPGIEELDIQGADGHIYKGRIEARLPTTLQQSAPGVLNGPRQSGQSPKMSHKIVYAQPGAPRPPGTAPVPVPPTSTSMGATRSPPRPSSARVIKPSPVVPKQATIPTAGVVEHSSEPPATQT